MNYLVKFLMSYMKINRIRELYFIYFLKIEIRDLGLHKGNELKCISTNNILTFRKVRVRKRQPMTVDMTLKSSNEFSLFSN
jgi:hypothetical protein